jgi:hypothetical protein
VKTEIFLQRGMDSEFNGRTDLPVGHEAYRAALAAPDLSGTPDLV